MRERAIVWLIVNPRVCMQWGIESGQLAFLYLFMMFLALGSVHCETHNKIAPETGSSIFGICGWTSDDVIRFLFNIKN